MLNPDEPRFEAYLKQFRPLPPAPLPLNVPANAPHKPRHLGITVWTLSVAAILAIVILHSRARRVTPAGQRTDSTIAHPEISQPLTLGSANQLLVNSPSFAAALRTIGLESKSSRVPKGKESALTVLRQEDLNP